MKLQKLNITEMTLRGPDLSKQLQQSLEAITAHLEQGKITPEHTGDMEDIKVLYTDAYKGNTYIFEQQDQPIGVAELFEQQDGVLVQNVYIAPENRKQRIFAKFLWFLKTREQYSTITLGDVQSPDMIEALKHIHHRFEVYWEKDGQKEQFDPDTADRYYSDTRKTGWRVVLENDGDFSDWPRYNVSAQYCLEHGINIAYLSYDFADGGMV